MAKLKRRSPIFAVAGVIMMSAGALATVQALWGLFSTDPLAPTVYAAIASFLPSLPRIIVATIWLVVTCAGLVLVVGVFRRTAALHATSPQLEVD